VTFEDAHVAECKDPPGTVRAAPGKTPLGMLINGELDAAVLSDPMPQDARLRSVIPDPAAAAEDWRRRKGALQINHMVTVRKDLDSGVVREVFDLLSRSKKAMKEQPQPDTSPFGLENNRRNLEVAIDYVHRQGLIPKRWAVEELFDETTRTLGA
jgi:4,5-dihydroxyphthalate decarboxylase